MIANQELRLRKDSKHKVKLKSFL